MFIRRVTILQSPVKDEDQEAKDEQGQVEDVDLEEMEEGETGYSHKHCRQIARKCAIKTDGEGRRILLTLIPQGESRNTHITPWNGIEAFKSCLSNVDVYEIDNPG